MEAGSRETLKSAWMTVRYEGWFWPTFSDRFVTLCSDCLQIHLNDESVEPETEISLDKITGLTVMTAVPGTSKPGLQVKTASKDFYLASCDEKPSTVRDLELWVPAILAAKEGALFVLPKDQEVLLEFSMNSEDEVEDEPRPSEEEIEAERERKAEHERREMEREAEIAEQERRQREDLLALGQISRSWDSVLKRGMLVRSLVRCSNFLSKERVRDLHLFADGKHLLQLLRGVGIEPVLDEDAASSNGRGAGNVQLIQACLNSLHAVFPAFPGADASQIASGNERVIVNVVWAILYSQFIRRTEFGGFHGLAAVALFVQQSTRGYNHVRISHDLAGSFCNSFALNAILHHFAPNSVEYDIISAAHIERNLSRCFQKANELFKVPLLLDASDFLDPATFCENSLVLYLTAFCQCVTKH